MPTFQAVHIPTGERGIKIQFPSDAPMDQIKRTLAGAIEQARKSIHALDRERADEMRCEQVD